MNCTIKGVISYELLDKLYIIYKEHTQNIEYEQVVREITDVSTIPELRKLLPTFLKIAKKHIPIDDLHIGKGYGTCVFVNAPPSETTNQKWHRDSEFESYGIYIPLIDINKQNGCMQVISESIFIKPKAWRKKSKDILDVTLSRGDICIFDGRLLHRGLANKSPEDRPVLICSVTSKNIEYFQESEIESATNL
tara:strand:- start:541 stop:1119 length:579 start_codon:yes stop_codon:yes gene_type:complete